jgi:hypothetical protein
MVSLCQLMRLALGAEKAALPGLLNEEFVNWTWRDDTYSNRVAACYMMADDCEPAIKWLQNSVNKGFIPYCHFRDHEPFFGRLRSDPRLEAHMARVKREWEAFEA